MINTVPKQVTLVNAIEPMMVKSVNTTFDITEYGTVSLTGVISYLSSNSAPPQIEILIVNEDISTTTSASASALSSTGSNIQASTYFHPFSFLLNSSDPLPVSLNAHADSTYTFALQQSVFFVPSMPIASDDGVSITAAVASDMIALMKSIVAVVSTPVPQAGTLAPTMQTSVVVLEREGSLGRYQLFMGSLSMTVDSRAIVDVVVTLRDGTVIKDEYNKFSDS